VLRLKAEVKSAGPRKLSFVEIENADVAEDLDELVVPVDVELCGFHFWRGSRLFKLQLDDRWPQVIVLNAQDGLYA